MKKNKQENINFLISISDIPRNTVHEPEQEAYLIRKEHMKAIESSLDYLEPLEKEIIKMKYGFGDSNYTTDEVAKEFRVKTEDVNILEQHAINKIKSYLTRL